MRFVDRHRIWFGFQKITALAQHYGLQVQFEGLPIQVDDWREINVQNRIAVQFQRSAQHFCSPVEGAGVENQIVHRSVASAWQEPFRLILPPKTPGT